MPILSQNQEISMIVLGVLIWFAMVVPLYAASIELRKAVDTKERRPALSDYCATVFQVRCVVWGGLSGLFVGTWVTVISYWFVLLAAFISMVLIGLVSTLILLEKTGESTLKKPRKVVLFLVSGTTIFWACSLTMHWILVPDDLPHFNTFKGTAEILGVALSLVSVILFFWERMPMKLPSSSE